MVLIAFDPDYERSGYAVYMGNILKEYGTVRLSQVKDLLKKYKTNGLEVVIENQYIPRQVKNAQSIIKLAHIAGAIWGICRVYGIENVRFIEPLAWMQWAVGSLRGLKSKERQEKIKQRADEIARKNNLSLAGNNEERAAICIGFYYLTKK